MRPIQVIKANRKYCVNGKVESGALKFSFFGSESLLLVTDCQCNIGNAEKVYFLHIPFSTLLVAQDSERLPRLKN